MDAALGERLEAYSNAVREFIPDYAEAVEQLVSRLSSSGAGLDAPRPGEPMPPFVLPDEKGRLTSLESLLQNGPIAITFHRGHWCPWCRISASVMAQARRDIAAARGQIAQSCPSGRGSRRIQIQHQVAIPRLYRRGQRLRTVAELGHLDRAGSQAAAGVVRALVARLSGKRGLDVADSGDLRGRTRWYRDGTLCRSGFSPTNVDRGIDRGARSRVEARYIAPGYRVDSQSIFSQSLRSLFTACREEPEYA